MNVIHRDGLCVACKRPIRLFNRNGEHVADEVHRPRLIETGVDGPAEVAGRLLFAVRQRLVCDKGERE